MDTPEGPASGARRIDDRTGARRIDGRWAVGALTGAARRAMSNGASSRAGQLRTAVMAWSYRLAETSQRCRHQVYGGMYLFGLTPWDRPAPNPWLVATVGQPVAPPGHALELGCGTGTNSIYLAQQGWNVTAVDMVGKALASARRKAGAANVQPRFIKGDVTRLAELGLSAQYNLLFDIGCFHAIPVARRDDYVKSVSAVAAPGAVLLLIGQFARPARDRRNAGVTPDEVRQRFTGWELVSSERMKPEPLRGGRPDQAAVWFDIWHYQLRWPESAPAIS
ncbi:MAG TPA: class I SAM-dependent methyltransferase [Streptosporangiaceae bacterium]|nr:class I SAM-dependent methyltransferase [Streptosporangiaceae bacterium]